MGRRKIDIVRIENERHRQVTFTKRKGGLIKKATELSILCDAEVAVIIFANNQKMSVYSSCKCDDIVKKYMEHKDLPEVRRLHQCCAAQPQGPDALPTTTCALAGAHDRGLLPRQKPQGGPQRGGPRAR